MPHFPEEIEYSDKYCDDYYEYRHVILPKHLFKKMTRNKIMNETEWRSLGVQQSRGWQHYEIHRPEPHILLFRRAIGTDPQTGKPPSDFKPPY
ncbi:cyclin-dependent kinase regulatory subunit (macronuclear) [Tetrahymena thermophila SB210]|uniref:Cyclin-dependent kinases regulatory subunit n=1 Tax=Tetrahymena thermophila (strain SB210) TaxID=312017 RepID=W7XKV4_TETTS|nr:cyclin-dependent kinase regulatory subunit [Tetrahymena thermophila SB210]EWS75259.1 cyclin-dependent kinase regulatory subunit [Tetrahymena thermophila SB210]|eukprot:XP_012652250.1 cyclin-dependent kinase regulatory subunit [Tetrahymena thermophila SB210]